MKDFKTAFLGDDLGVSICDRVSGRFITALQVVLAKACPKSHIIEMVGVLGKDLVLKFLDIFAGTTLKVPTKAVLEDCMRDIIIYLQVKRTEPFRRPGVIRELARKTGLTAGEVRSIFVDVDALFQKEGFITP